MKFEMLDEIKEESYEKREYLDNLSLSGARMFFRLRTRTFKCKMNQSSEKANWESLWKCQACGKVDTQSHIIHCVAYKDLRIGKSLHSDAEVAEYFKAVLKQREIYD